MKKILFFMLLVSILFPLATTHAEEKIRAYYTDEWSYICTKIIDDASVATYLYRLIVHYQTNPLGQYLNALSFTKDSCPANDPYAHQFIIPTIGPVFDPNQQQGQRVIYYKDFQFSNNESPDAKYADLHNYFDSAKYFLEGNLLDHWENGKVVGKIKSDYISFEVAPPLPPTQLPPSETDPLMVPVEKMSITKDPINIATGEMLVQSTDISLKGKGQALQLARTYRSQSNLNGLFGYGWRTAYDVNLTTDAEGNVIIIDEKGVVNYFSMQGVGYYIPAYGTYCSLKKNEDGTHTLTNKHGIVSIYDLNGRFSTVTDRNGNTLKFVYNISKSDGSYIEDTSGRRITLTLDANGHVISAKDPADRIFQYSYDSSGNLITVTDPAGNITTYDYDDNHHIIAITNGNGHKTYFAYDAQGRAYSNWQEGDVNKATLDFEDPYYGSVSVCVTDSLGNKNSYKFAAGLEYSHTDPLGIITEHNWDTRSKLLACFRENANHTGPQPRVIGRINQFLSDNPNENINTVFEYDSNGNLIRVRGALGNYTTMTYTSDINLLSSTTDAMGNVTQLTYDSKGNPIKTTDAFGNEHSRTYDEFGNLLTETDSLGHKTTFVYDDFGQLIQQTDALGNKIYYSYDAAGNMITKTDALGRKTIYQYDSLNRLTKTIFPDKTFISSTYDAMGNVLSVTDQKGNTTTKEYDTYERLVKTTDAKGGVTEYTYDTEGHLFTLKDANSNVTTYTYDPNGKILTETNALGATITNVYDKVGNLISKTNANGDTITYKYDALSRLLETEYPDSTKVTNEYDPLRRKTSMTDSRGQTLYTYDELSRLLSVVGPTANDTISYSYDKEGNRLTTVDQTGQTIYYTYDALNRLSSVADAKGKTSYSYNAVSNKTLIKYPNHVSEKYTYDVMNRVKSVTNISGKVTISSFNYTYDPAGMVTQKKYRDGSFVTYSYDVLNQLLRETKQKATITSYDYVYTYDAVGNRLSFTKNTTLGSFWNNDSKNMPAKVRSDMEAAGFGESSPNLNQALALVKNYQYDQGNQLLNWDNTINISTQALPVETVSYSYDNNGNRTLKTRLRSGEALPQETNYSYDYEDRLTKLDYTRVPEVSRTGVQHDTFAYGGDGARVQAVEKNITTNYYYDGSEVVVERDGSENIKKFYSRALGYPGGIGGLISQTSIGAKLVQTTSYYNYDALGSVVNVVSSKGGNSISYDYDAFGNSIVAPSKTNNYLFSTKEFEPRSGLYYFGARYYDPEIARWLTPDPAGMVDGTNLYLYCRNSPINFVDPLGLCGEKPWWEKVFPSLIGSSQWHYDRANDGEKLIHYLYKKKWFRFNKIGELAEHSGKALGKATGKAAEALKYLKNVKPDFFLRTPILIIIPPELMRDPVSPFYDSDSGGGTI